MHAPTSLFFAALLGSAVANKIPRDAWYGKSSWATGSTSSVPTSSSSAIPHSSTPTPTGTGITPTVTPPTPSPADKPTPSKSTEILTSFTTTTVCPVTYTRYHHSTAEIVTSYTTSTLTITSCKAGCNHHPTSYPVPSPSTTTVPPKPTQPPKTEDVKTITTVVYSTTVLTTYTKFVPCSTPVATSAGTTYYSTWLTPSLIPTSYVSTVTDTYTKSAPTKTPAGPADTCPPAKTVTVTIGSGAQPTPPPVDCKSCLEVHTLTLTNGQTSVITVTNSQPTVGPAKPTYTPPTGTGKPSKPKGTGSPHGTGNVKWHKPSASPRSW